MGFKKLKPPPKPEPKPIPDPNQTKLNLTRNVHIDELIAKSAALPDLSSSNFNSNIVKWDQEPGRNMVDPETSIGMLFAVGEFNPFGNNDFVLIINSEQTQYSVHHSMSRCYLLNQDLSPVINPKGEPRQSIFNNAYLTKFIGYATSSIAN